MPHKPLSPVEKQRLKHEKELFCYHLLMITRLPDCYYGDESIRNEHYKSLLNKRILLEKNLLKGPNVFLAHAKDIINKIATIDDLQSTEKQFNQLVLTPRKSRLVLNYSVFTFLSSLCSVRAELSLKLLMHNNPRILQQLSNKKFDNLVYLAAWNHLSELIPYLAQEGKRRNRSLDNYTTQLYKDGDIFFFRGTPFVAAILSIADNPHNLNTTRIKQAQTTIELLIKYGANPLQVYKVDDISLKELKAIVAGKIKGRSYTIFEVFNDVDELAKNFAQHPEKINEVLYIELSYFVRWVKSLHPDRNTESLTNSISPDDIKWFVTYAQACFTRHAKLKRHEIVDIIVAGFFLMAYRITNNKTQAEKLKQTILIESLNIAVSHTTKPSPLYEQCFDKEFLSMVSTQVTQWQSSISQRQSHEAAKPPSSLIQLSLFPPSAAKPVEEKQSQLSLQQPSSPGKR